MTLRTKTLAAIVGTLAVLMCVLYLISREIVVGGFAKVETASLQGFAAIEDADARQNVGRVTDALGYRVETLATKAADWAMWDDCYRFVKDHNKAFITSNLGKDALGPIKINFLLIIDEAGKLVHGSGYDLSQSKEHPLPASLMSYITPGGMLLAHDGPEHLVSGILSLPEGPMMVVSRPIVTSEGKGPLRGSVIFGRYFDDPEFDQLAKITHLKIVRCYAKAGAVPDDFTKALSRISPASPVLIEPASNEVIRGYTIVRDLDGKDSLYLRVDIARDIYSQGLVTRDAIHERGGVILTSLVVSILFTGLVVCLVIGFVLERWVLGRLSRVSRKAVKIGEESDFSARVRVDGADEIASLAASVNRMLGALEGSHHEIELRNNEMRLIMDTTPAGLLSLDENFCINPEYSRAAARMAGDLPLKGMRFTEALGLTGERAGDARGLEEFFDVMRQELIDEDSMAGLNPLPELRMELGAVERWLRLRYYNIHRAEGQANHILAVMEDITEQKRLAAQVADSARENLQLKAIAEDPELFREFLSESSAILRAVEVKAGQLELSEASRPLVNDIFRGVHTIKGVSGSFGLVQLAECAGELESALEPLRREGEVLTPEHIDDTLESLKRLATCFGEAKESARQILGDDVDSEGSVFLRVSSEDLRRYIEEIKGMAVDEELKDAMIAKIKRECVRRLAALRSVPARRGLARSIKIVPGLIERLGKDAEFNFSGETTPIDCDVARELNTPLIHMIRNAIDHGIEDLEARVEAGKPERGRVTLSVEPADGKLKIILADDGKGLDAEALKAVALRKGIITREEAAALSTQGAYGLIFRPGFSTADEITDVSGRGVGMDAVRVSVCETLGGALRVESQKGQGTSFIIEV